MADPDAHARILAVEHKLADAESRFRAMDRQAIASGQGLWEFATAGGGIGSGFGGGGIFNGSGVGGGGGTSFDCLAFTVKGQGCASPVLLPGATITVNDILGNTVAFATTDASGNANLCLVDGQTYSIDFAATGHTTATIADTWPFPVTSRTVVLGYPHGQICWNGCPLPMRADLLLTSRFGSVRLSTAGTPAAFQTGTANLIDPTCTMATFGGSYQILWSIGQFGSGYSSLTASLYAINCGLTSDPFLGSTYKPWDGVNGPTPSPRKFATRSPASASCGPPFFATFDFSSVPAVFGNVGPYTVTLDGT